MRTELKMIYSGLDFFGHHQSYMECEMIYPKIHDMKKCFMYLRKNSDGAIHYLHTDGVWYSAYYNSEKDFNAGILTIAISPRPNVRELETIAFDKCKGKFYKFFTEDGNNDY